MQHVTFSFNADETKILSNPHEAAASAVESGQAKWATVHEARTVVRGDIYQVLHKDDGLGPDTTYISDATLASKFPQDDVYIV